MAVTVHQFPCLSDNYGFLLHDSVSGETACIDTPDAAAYLDAAAAKGWMITHIWNTHWHPDHAGRNAAIVAATGAKVIAPMGEGERIAAVDIRVGGGDTIQLGAHDVKVIDVAGHTLGHVAYHLPDQGIAFVGDSLFALGCGRMFEGTPDMFWASLLRLKALPSATTLYCAHEYTASNARFAVHVDPDNADLAAYAAEIAARRADGLPTVPMILSRELATNPFLRADDVEFQAVAGVPGDAVASFAKLRAAKDSF